MVLLREMLKSYEQVFSSRLLEETASSSPCFMPKTRVSVQDEMWFAGPVRFLRDYLVHLHPYFMHEETEAQRAEGTCPRSHSE